MTPAALPPPFDQVYRLKVSQYEAMCEHGIIGRNDRVELLGGLMVQKFRQTPMHSTVRGMCTRTLRKIEQPGYFVLEAGAIAIPDYDEPGVWQRFATNWAIRPNI